MKRITRRQLRRVLGLACAATLPFAVIAVGAEATTVDFCGGTAPGCSVGNMQATTGSSPYRSNVTGTYAAETGNGCSGCHTVGTGLTTTGSTAYALGAVFHSFGGTVGGYG